MGCINTGESLRQVGILFAQANFRSMKFPEAPEFTSTCRFVLGTVLERELEKS